MALLLQYTLIFASVLMLVALGGCFAERSGIINIGLEGIMVIGALGGALAMKFIPVSVGAPVMILATIAASAIAGSSASSSVSAARRAQFFLIVLHPSSPLCILDERACAVHPKFCLTGKFTLS